MVDEDSLPSYSAAARAISEDDPPAWLVEFFKRWGPCLTSDRGVAAFKIQTKAQMRLKLEGVRAAAALIRESLDDGETRAFLDAATPGKIADPLAILRLMNDLVRRAEEAVSWLLTNDGKTKSGRSRAVPPGYFDPKTYCAAIIIEAWNAVRDVEPSSRSSGAAIAADLFWRESREGLSMEETKLALERMLAKEPRSWGNELNGWRRHFEEARKPHVAEMRKEIRRHLAEDKRRAGRFDSA